MKTRYPTQRHPQSSSVLFLPLLGVMLSSCGADPPVAGAGAVASSRQALVDVAPIAAWSFDDCSTASLITDESGQGHHGIKRNVVCAPGYSGEALGGGYVEVPSFPSSSEITVTAWVKLRQPRSGVVDYFFGGQNFSAVFGLNAYGQDSIWFNSPGLVIAYFDASNYGRWMHVAFVVRRSGTASYGEIYLDGRLASSSRLFPVSTIAPQFLNLGASRIGATSNDKVLDQMRVYASALTAEQIAADGGFCSCTGTDRNGQSVTVSCGGELCAADGTTHRCMGHGQWYATGRSCDPGGCTCSGMNSAGAPVTASCGEVICGPGNIQHECTSSGFVSLNRSCGLGGCACIGTDYRGNRVTVGCRERICGADEQYQECVADLTWRPTGVGCASRATCAPEPANCNVSGSLGATSCAQNGQILECRQSANGTDADWAIASTAAFSCVPSCGCFLAPLSDACGDLKVGYEGSRVCGAGFQEQTCVNGAWVAAGASCAMYCPPGGIFTAPAPAACEQRFAVGPGQPYESICELIIRDDLSSAVLANQLFSVTLRNQLPYHFCSGGFVQTRDGSHVLLTAAHCHDIFPQILGAYMSAPNADPAALAPYLASDGLPWGLFAVRCGNGQRYAIDLGQPWSACGTADAALVRTTEGPARRLAISPTDIAQLAAWYLALFSPEHQYSARLWRDGGLCGSDLRDSACAGNACVLPTQRMLLHTRYERPRPGDSGSLLFDNNGAWPTAVRGVFARAADVGPLTLTSVSPGGAVLQCFPQLLSDAQARVVHINGCDSGVPNLSLPDGATFNERVGECVNRARNRGELVSCVSLLANQWRRDELITREQRVALQGCL
jgi:hypothetical protein